jgi:hypothetical protein
MTGVVFGYQLGQEVYSIHSIQTSFGLYLASCSMEALPFIWHKVSMTWSWSLAFIQVNNAWSYTTTVPYIMALSLMKDLYLCLPELPGWIPLVRLIWIVPYLCCMGRVHFSGLHGYKNVKSWKHEMTLKAELMFINPCFNMHVNWTLSVYRTEPYFIYTWCCNCPSFTQ